jgi:acid phosphatase type 7
MSMRKFAVTPSKFMLQKYHGVNPHQQFQTLPPPTGQAPYRLKLEDVLPEDRMKTIKEKLVFQTAGDTGGIQSGTAQVIVAQHMENDLNSSQGSDKPAFFYHLGDVVYFYGEADHYYGQFYDPYQNYNAPIFAIPGNHDGAVLGGQVPSLAAFVNNFCAPVPQITPEAGDVMRHAMTQPNAYWTLEAPYATIIGLYTNVPEGGILDQDQIDWFQSEMKTADKDKALIVAMHHPIYSGDKWHSGSAYMGDILDQAIKETKRVPDMVLAGHVHNYQRFTRKYHMDGRDYQIPYIVAGAGGYFHLHYEQMLDGNTVNFGRTFTQEQVTLDRYCDDRHGFLRLEVTRNEIKGIYLTVPRPQEKWRTPAQIFDTFVHQLKIPAGVGR